MICVLEKKLLDDKFIDKRFIKDINANERILFNNKNIYYFGNYKKDSLNIIKNKLLKNKRNIVNAIERNIKIIITGNSIELFNNTFKYNDLNLFTAYNKSNKFRILNDLKRGLDTYNFKYKNLICFNNIKLINKIIKKTKYTTLSN